MTVQARPRPRGFTLIELMVALAIAALLLLLGVPSFTTFLRNSEIRSTSRIDHQRPARGDHRGGEPQPKGHLRTGQRHRRRLEILGPRRQRGPRRRSRRYSKKEAGPNTKITLTPAGKLSVTFNGLGRVDIDPADPDDHIRQIDIDSIVAGEARPLRIIVDDPNPPAAGKPRGLRMCDPDPALAALVPPDPRAC